MKGPQTQRCRAISGLLWVERTQSPWPKAPKLLGLAAQGRRYENAIAKALPAAKQGVWFKFEDRNGVGYCSPDLLFEVDGTPWVAEVKLSLVPEAYAQLSTLYLPVLRHFLGRSPRTLIITKFLGRGQSRAVPFPSLAAALSAPDWGVPGLLLAPLTSKAHLKAQFALPH